ncbi:MAG: S1 RNA-binding domain-containing protein [Tissierellia bacterium]|nr:S1 RNA-binding domain-containing protein [Tissierellia bacterium]
MALKTGDVVEGKVTSIVPFGCFVELEDGVTALCHISELSNDYVEDISSYVQKNQSLRFKVIEAKDKKIALSLKAMTEGEDRPKKPQVFQSAATLERGEQSFEDKMAKFIKESNEKIQSINQRNSRRRNSSRTKR